jgi:hypothetical protein
MLQIVESLHVVNTSMLVMYASTVFCVYHANRLQPGSTNVNYVQVLYVDDLAVKVNAVRCWRVLKTS